MSVVCFLVVHPGGTLDLAINDPESQIMIIIATS